MAAPLSKLIKGGGREPFPFFLVSSAALALMAATPAAGALSEGQAEPIACADAIGAGPLLWRSEQLAAARRAIAAGDPALEPAYERLMAEAEAALGRGPYTVTNKQVAPPSGDVHDYTSLGPYWWPDPAQRDGRPYIRRDGETNPERDGPNFDRRRSQNMTDDATTLALAAYFSGEQRYAEHAERLIHTWFVDPETRMNPNLNHGQAIPGRTEGRGIGIIDTRIYVPVMDSARLLAQEGWLDLETESGLRTWALDYARWLISSPLGQDERATLNNHGVYYDLQLAAFAAMAGDCAVPQRVFQDTRMRLDTQIEADGRMPEEEKRTRSLHYYIFNLLAFFDVARLAEHFGENLYAYEGTDGAGMPDTLALLLPYAGAEDDWPHQMIGDPADRDLWRLLRVAGLVYDSPAVAQAQARASGRDPADRIMLLTFEPETPR